MAKNNKNLTGIGKRLKEVRKIISGKLREMSEISGFRISTISEMEAARNKPNTEYLLLLAEKFNVNLNWIYTGKGAMFLPDFELNFDFGRDSESILEMIYLVENCEFVRFEILSHYIKLRDENKDKIKDYLPGKKGD